MRCTPHGMHAYETDAHDIHGYKIYEMHTYEMRAYEGFCEDLERQNAVAHLSQLQLRFRRCHIWVSVAAGVS
jgi:hypothetical protein